jgi:MFS family permease
MILIPRIARWVSTVGIVIVCVSLALSSFASNTTQLILAQGVAYGIGACFSYTPSILYMSEWFVKRKGLAFGISLVWNLYSVSRLPFYMCESDANSVHRLDQESLESYSLHL